jgi:hypothetical protein
VAIKKADSSLFSVLMIFRLSEDDDIFNTAAALRIDPPAAPFHRNNSRTVVHVWPLTAMARSALVMQKNAAPFS